MFGKKILTIIQVVDIIFLVGNINCTIGKRGLRKMTTWTVESLVGVINHERLRQSITETPFGELVDVHNALRNVLSVCLNCCDIPETACIVSDLFNAYAVEITDRLTR